MQISFYGYNCFKINARAQVDASSPRETVGIITDPYADTIGLKTPSVTADIALISRDHKDHNNVGTVKGDPFVIDGPGEYAIRGVGIEGFFAPNDEEEDRSTQYSVEVEDVRLAFLFGAQGKELNDEQLERLGLVDVLFLPVGGNSAVGPKEAGALINDIEPRVVVPMHYNLKGLKHDLASVDDFLDEMGAKAREEESFTISASSLPQEEMDIVVLEAKGVK